MNMKYADSYLPEIDLLAQKKSFSARHCREDCAVVSAVDPSRVLACRCRIASGRSPDPAATPTSLFGIPASDLQFLKSHLAPHRLLVLAGSPSPVLVSCDLLEAAEVLLMLSPHQADADALLRALTVRLANTEILISPSLCQISPTAHRNDPQIEELILEWMFYASRIGAEQERIGLRTRAMLIANFTGCRTEVAEPCEDELSLSRVVCHRVSAFLLCALLTLRDRDGDPHTPSDTANEVAPAFRLSLLQSDHQEETRTEPPLGAPMLAHSEFQGLRAWLTPQGIRFAFSLPREAMPALFCTEPSQDNAELVLIFEKITQNALIL